MAVPESWMWRGIGTPGRGGRALPGCRRPAIPRHPRRWSIGCPVSPLPRSTLLPGYRDSFRFVRSGYSLARLNALQSDIDDSHARPSQHAQPAETHHSPGVISSQHVAGDWAIDKNESPNLTIELLPSSSWGKNARRRETRAMWDCIRAAAIAKANGVCAICGGTGRLECHESWEFEEATQIQRLVDVIPLCHLCHAAKHPGRLDPTGTLARDVARHYMLVNGVTREVYREHVENAFRVWKDRSLIDWQLEMSRLYQLIQETGQTTFLEDGVPSTDQCEE